MNAQVRDEDTVRTSLANQARVFRLELFDLQTDQHVDRDQPTAEC